MNDHPDERSRTSVHVPFGIVVLVVLLGFGWIAFKHWREGALLLALGLLLGAVLRGTLSDEQAGLLAVRGRRVDMLLYGGLGLVIAAVALTITGGILGA